MDTDNIIRQRAKALSDRIGELEAQADRNPEKRGELLQMADHLAVELTACWDVLKERAKQRAR